MVAFQGVGCARPGVPGVYARVSGVENWIQDQICELSEIPPVSCTNGITRTGFIRLNIYYDGNPTDISWSIKTVAGEVIETSNEVSDPKVLVSTFVDIDDGAYVFEVSDVFGDGFEDGECYRTKYVSFEIHPSHNRPFPQKVDSRCTTTAMN